MLPYVIALLQIPYAVFASINGTEENDDRRVHCPRPESATSSCDAPTFFTYYACCGEANMFCCMRLQLHIIIGGAVILVIILVAIAALFVNWVCRIIGPHDRGRTEHCCYDPVEQSRGRKGHQSYDFS